MENRFENEAGPGIPFAGLDRETVFKLPGRPDYFIRVAQRHCANNGKENCNHICAVFPNPQAKTWDIRWALPDELPDNAMVIPVGPCQ